MLRLRLGPFAPTYSQPQHRAAFDLVVTCFIDTGPDLAQTLAVLGHVLRPGGLWISELLLLGCCCSAAGLFSWLLVALCSVL